ncbi:MAG TPA: phosphoribosylglycinamide formyltransferase [Stellaceae bacterium]|nr:phosphoribosylglycinamide formyltransferase [Stellaceae bacterium]
MRGGLKLGFLASHGGSSMKAILGAIAEGELRASASVVISNNADAEALSHSRALGIPAYHLSETRLGNADALDRAVAETLAERGAELIVLSGYMRKIGPLTLARFRHRILNIHPGPLPKFGGRGMYGRFVHEAVIAAGERLSGICIHVVDDEYDHGPVLARREVPVEPGDTAETLAARVRAQEPAFFVDTLRRIAEGTLRLPG